MRFSVFLCVIFLSVFFMTGESYSLILESDAFKDGEEIPLRYTGDGDDMSPALRWSDVPEGTESFALIMDDPDAPFGVWVHWVVYDIPDDKESLEENMPKETLLTGGIRQGVNSFRRVGYNGPHPPKGTSHRYVFTLYALSAKTGIGPAGTKEAVMDAVKGDVLAEASLTGVYSR